MAGKQPPLEIRVPGAFDQFYRDQYPKLVVVSYALCGDRGTAEHLCQEAFLRARRDWNEVGRLDSPERWVYRTAVALTGSILARRRAVMASRLGLVTTSETLESRTDAGCEAFWRGVRALPRRQQEVVTLRYLSNRSVADITQILRIPEAEVRAALDGGNQRLIEVFQTKDSDSTVTYDERATAAAGALRASARSGHSPDLDAVSRNHRRAGGVATAVGALVAAVLLVGLLAVVSLVGGDSQSATATTTADEIVMPVAHGNSRYDYAIRLPSRWITAPEHLTVGGSGWEEVFAAGTVLYSPGTWACDRQAPAAMRNLSGDNLLLVIQERVRYVPQDLPIVESFDAVAGDPIPLSGDCFETGASGGGVGFERTGRGFVAWWGFGTVATTADRDELWAVLDSFAPEANPTVAADAAVYQSSGFCGISNMPVGWRDDAFTVGPLSLWTIGPPTTTGDGDTWTKTIAVVDGRESVTIRVASGAEELASHLFDPDTWTGEPYVVADGRTAVTFLPCTDASSQHVGGFITRPGVECLPWDIRVASEVSLRAVIPVLGGDC
jgi:DNA-directed RNA polymerase specialized sigma24 family protein